MVVGNRAEARVTIIKVVFVGGVSFDSWWNTLTAGIETMEVKPGLPSGSVS